jgi:glycosyltransferase involved in cell wall biosynthesis
MTFQPSLSIVIPVYNEEKNIFPLYSELTLALRSMALSYEILFIDDGSSDNSFEELSKIHAEDNLVKVIQFRRNFGQTAAFAAGFDAAVGDLILTIDADGQNDPNDIPKLLETMREGNYDFVTGWRVNRRESLIRKFLTKSANKIINRSSQIDIHDRGCSLKLMKRDVVKNIRLYGQLHRFLPELASTIGVKIGEVPVNDRSRLSGKSKYGSVSRTPRVILDLITVFYLLTFFTSPMRLFGSMAIVCGLSGFVIAGMLAIEKIYHGIIGGWQGFHAYQIGNRPLLLLAVLLIVVGVQLLMMGLLGEMIMRIYYESRDKPVYYVRQVLENQNEFNHDQVFSAQKSHDIPYPTHHPKGEHNAG